MGKNTSSVMLTAIAQTLGVRATTERWVRMSLSGAGAQSCSNHRARLNPYDFNVSGSRTLLLLFQMLKSKARFADPSELLVTMRCPCFISKYSM